MNRKQYELERKRRFDKNRPSRSKRGYGRDWQRVRLAHLEMEPFCRFCKERNWLVAAQVVDHIISIEERPDLRLEHSNLRSLCKSCHDSRTSFDHGFNRGKNRRLYIKGSDINGMPLDPNHPWNR